jgi:serine/threonine-protein kinase
MPDLIGRTLGHYRIVEKIGAGGMGIVYRARDERLGREVAVKVLPEEGAGLRDRFERFEREAKLLASLNHRNIATLHGLEEEDGVRYLVMELLQGESLAGIIARGAVPVEEALRIALQITRALEAAHEQGIIHRDLKPGNVMVDSEGQVKVLDFGLARAFDPEASSPMAPDSLAESPTLTADLTRVGVLLGTVAYMSPEQASGKPVDKRADIWAFGCTLYEMLSGSRAFEGATATEVLAATIKEEPDWDSLPADTPISVRRLLRRCLTKDLRDRLHDISDARIELQEAEEVEQPIDPQATSRWRSAVPWGVAIGAVLFAVVALMVDRSPSLTQEPRAVSRSTVVLPDSQPIALAESAPMGSARPSIALSPDGKTLVLAVRSEEGTRLSVREMSQHNVSPIPGTEGAFDPFFSPDGEWVAFFTETELKKVSLKNRQVLTLCEAKNAYGGHWGEDAYIYFSEEFGGPVSRVPAEGGRPEATVADGAFPRLLPDQKTLLVTRGHKFAPSIEAFQLDGGEPRVVVERGGDAHYLPTGHLVFSRTGQLLAAPFEVGRNQLTGPAVPVLNGVVTGIYDGAQAAFSEHGRVAYLPGPPVTEVTPVWIDTKGRASPTGLASGIYACPRFSPDGDRLAVVSMQVSANVWVYDLDRRAGLRIAEPGRYCYLAWTPDGEWIIYGKAGYRVFRRRSSGTGDEERLGNVEGIPLSVTPGGESLVGKNLLQGLWSLPLTADGEQAWWVEGTARESGLYRLSPDGKWMALTSSDSGRYEVYVEPFPPTGERWMISSEGGQEPVWSSSGDDVYFRYGNKLMAVTVKTEPTFTTGSARVIVEGNFASTPGYSYDIHPGGDRFLLFQRHEYHPVQLHSIENWFEELRQLVPTE